MEEQVRRRRRAALSCIACRRRKIKCDRKYPCSSCITINAKCDFKFRPRQSTVPQPSQHDRVPACSAAPSPPRLGSSEQAQHAVDGGETFASLDSRNANQWSSQPTEASVTPVPIEPSQPGQKSGNLDSHQQHNGILSTGRAIVEKRMGLQKGQLMLNKTKTLRSSHCLGFSEQLAPIREFFHQCTATMHGSKVSFLNSDASKPLVVQTAELLCKCKEQAKYLKAGRPSRSLSSPDFSLLPPPQNVSDKMVDLYFQFFESTHRILHTPTFHALYKKFWSHPELATTEIRLVIVLVISIGSSLFKPEVPEYELRTKVDGWIHAAQTWLAGPTDKNRLTILGLQIHCLTILARQLFSVGGDLIWMSAGTLVHMAMQMALHRDPKFLPTMTTLEAETRRRLWATILEITIQSALDSGMSARLSVEEFDTRPPANVNDLELIDSVTDVEPHPPHAFTSTSIQLLLQRTAATRLHGLHLMNDLHAGLAYSDVLALSSEILQACRTSRRFLEKNRLHGATVFHQNSTEFLLRRFLVPLHSPFAMDVKENPMFAHSLEICMDVAMTVIYPEPDEAFTRLLTVSGGMFREGLKSACLILSLKLINQVESQVADGTFSRITFRLDFVEQALRDLRFRIIQRTDHGETNVKIHMFLSMALAQYEATKAGASINHAIAKAAQDSLQYSHDTLGKRTSELMTQSEDTIDWFANVFADSNYGQSFNGFIDDAFSRQLSFDF